jgi:diadenosine tetraphosphatase ApaH/serine/threonine PP2A family protein phosphatase
MGRLIAIGDIHGKLSKLKGLIEKIEPSLDDRLIFPGDYIDRGPGSFEVVEFMLGLKKNLPNVVTLRGNHEDFVISLFMGNQSRRDREIWLTMNGGDQTMASYRRHDVYLKEHQEFYMDLPLLYETEEYFLCHAGVRPGVPLDKQKPYDLIEIRHDFLMPAEYFSKIIVHGHSISKEPEIRHNRIGIDTGAGGYSPLTAIALPSLRIWQQR